MRAYLQSQQDVEPAVIALLRAAKDLAGIEESIDITPLPDHPARNVPVLSLGPMDRQVFNHVVNAPSVAALMSKNDSLTRLSDALKLLAGGIVLPKMVYHVCETVEQVENALDELDCSGPVVLDIETSGDVEVDRPVYERIISLALYNGSINCPVVVIPEEMLRDPEVERMLGLFVRRNYIIAHNEKFDIPYFPERPPTAQRFDPMVAHYVLYPAGSTHGLKELCEQYFGVGDWDEALKKYTGAKVYKEAGTGEDGVWWDARKYSGGSGYERIPRSLLYEYNAYDVFYTWHLFLLLSDQLTIADKWPVFARRMEVSGMFMDIEQKGFTIDRDHLLKLKVMLEEEFRVAKEDLEVIAGYPINPNSVPQVLAWFAERGQELPRLRQKDAKGKVTVKPRTSKDAIAIVIENAKGKYDSDSIAFAKKLLELRGITKNLGTYVNGFLDRAHGNTVHTTFNVTGPMTGRIANRGAGILTIPRDKTYRKMVVPSGPGRVLVKPDYGQLEMRLVSFFSRDPRFVAAFQPGMPDFFTQMMPEVYPDIDLSALSPSEHAELRNGVKPISHGANYGRQYAAIAAQLGMDVNEAKEIYDRYMGPLDVGLYPWQQGIREAAGSNGDIVTPYGWHYQAEVVTEKNRNSVENSALAFGPQSTGNDICLGAALNIHPQLDQYDSWIVATIHDQIIADSPIEHATTVGKLLEAEMLAEGKRVVGDVLVFEAAPEYGFNWSEKMDQDGWDKWLEENYK